MLGNLTLVTQRLNSALSNAAWTTKRGTLNQYSVLMLNQRLIDAWPDRWDEDAIDQRGRQLAEVICRVWPGPDAWD